MSTLHFHSCFDNPFKVSESAKCLAIVMLNMTALASFSTGVILWRISDSVLLNDGLIVAGFALYIAGFMIKLGGGKRAELG